MRLRAREEEPWTQPGVALRYLVENNILAGEKHLTETKAGAIWLACWLSASYAYCEHSPSVYLVTDLGVAPPVRVRLLGWTPPATWPNCERWPVGWSYWEV